jgi:MoaA/NifB/PqqE/SkfB family radical SAM enzyme
MRPACDSILSEVQSKAHSRTSLDEMLETLDTAKPVLFERLRKHFEFPIEAKALTQKILNLCLAKYHFLSRSTVVLSRPFGLVIDPSNSCNLACPGCVHSQQVKALKLFEWNPGLLAETRVGAFLKSYGPNATHATLCNYGEPLINPDTPKFVHIAKSYLAQTWLSTNIAVLKFDADAYVESGLDFMVLSIDGATQPVYERFRRKGKLELVFENIRKLVEAKRRLGRSMPILQWRFLGFEHNVHEIPLAMEKARELGVNQFAASPAWDISWDEPDIRPANIENTIVNFGPDHRAAVMENWNPRGGSLAESALEHEFDQRWTDKAEARSARSVRSESAPGPGQTCEFLYKSITMDAGGRIFPCCCSPTPNRDLTFAQFDIGSSGDEFNSDKHQRSRLAFVDPKAYQLDRDARGLDRDPYCVKCEWDKTADPNNKQIRNYFQAAVPDLIGDQCLKVLSNW